jgi:flagellar FliJ protein
VKFKFGFEKILEHKRSLENAARRDYNDCLQKVEASEKELRELYDSIEQSRKRCHDLQTAGGMQSVALGQIDQFIHGQKIRIEIHKKKLRELKAIAEEAQDVVLAAAKERKIYEKLREQRLDQYKLLRKKRELKAVDELIVTRFKAGERKI